MFKKSIAAQRPFKLALLASIAMVAMASAPSFASNSDTATATANIVAPISVTKSKDLVFGQFVAAAGDVTVDTSGARTGTGVTLVSGVTPQAAKFDITGANSAAFTIDMTGTDPTIANGGNTMALTLYSDQDASGTKTGSPLATGTVGAGGTASLYFGGKLTVAGTEPAGTYTGTIKVTLAYQ